MLTWTGADVHALREYGLRQSRPDFAATIGVSVEAVGKWERRGESHTLRPEFAAIMDTAMARLDTTQVQRFQRARQQPDSPASTVPVDMLSVPDADLREWVAVNRRELLRLLGSVSSGASVAALTAGIEADALPRTAHRSAAADERAIAQIETIVANAAHQYEIFGAASVQPVRHAQSGLIDSLLAAGAPQPLERRLLTARGRLAEGLGWSASDAGRPDIAARHYESARLAADQAGDLELSALTLCNIAWLWTTQGRPGVGLDYALAARHWARRTDDPQLISYASNITAETQARLGHSADCRASLSEAADVADMPARGDSLAFFADKGLAASMRAGCLIRLGDPKAAVTAAAASVAHIDRDAILTRSFALVNLANAQYQTGDMDAAAETLIESARTGTSFGSVRLGVEIGQTRNRVAHKAPRCAALERLDDELAVLAA